MASREGRCLRANGTGQRVKDWPGVDEAEIRARTSAFELLFRRRFTLTGRSHDRGDGLTILKTSARAPQAKDVLRAPDRHDPAWVSGFCDSARGAPAADVLPGSGSHTIIAAVHMRAWARAFPNLRKCGAAVRRISGRARAPIRRCSSANLFVPAWKEW